MKNLMIFFAFIFIFGLLTCRKSKCEDPTNKACENYNPCSLIHPLSADFSIYENDCTAGPAATDTSWHYYPTDTVYTDCATFTVSDTTVDSVKWQIGAGTYTAKSFYLNFSSIKPTPVPITLTVYKHRNSCYPTDDTVKTLTKTLYFTDTCLAFGSYSGYFDNNPVDTGTISMKRITVTVGTLIYGAVVLNGFKSGCIDTISGPFGSWEPFFTSLSFSVAQNSASCIWIYGSWYYNRNNNSVLIQYAEQYGTAHNFNGHKIN
jgi:hypothetical protein